MFHDRNVIFEENLSFPCMQRGLGVMEILLSEDPSMEIGFHPDENRNKNQVLFHLGQCVFLVGLFHLFRFRGKQNRHLFVDQLSQIIL